VSDFAKLEVNFVLLDHRYSTLCNEAKVLYIALWARARAELREVLPARYGIKQMAKDSGLSPRSVARMLHACMQNGLIAVYGVHGGDIQVTYMQHVGNLRATHMQHTCDLCGAEGIRISVCGIKSKHDKLAWKDDGFLVCAAARGRKSEVKSQERIESIGTVDPKSENPIDQKLPNVGEPIAGGGGSTAKTKFMEVARQKLDVNAAGLLERCVAGVKSAKVFRDGLAILEKCPRQIALMVWYAVKADNSAAYFTDVVKRGEVESECDAARIWAELASNQRKAVQA